ncbi:hypothetical protein [Corynebacterium nuruki]|nr:hypothetical protein [Corynebacterium nuruki]
MSSRKEAVRMAKLGSYRNITVEMNPDDTPKETLEKARHALQQAKAQVDEKQRREEAAAARKRQSFFGRLFG